MKVLIVEDNVAQSESLERLLKVSGTANVVYRAGAVEMAKNIAEAHSVDAVILDWIVPGGGLEFLSWLRQRELTRTVPVVVSTGLAREKVGLPSLPGVTVLEKPYELSDLLKALGG